jgi:transposase
MKNHIALCTHESVPELQAALTKSRDPAFKTRLKAIILRSRGKSPQEIAESLVVTDRSVTGWILRYNTGGIAGLMTKPSGRAEGNPKWEAEPFEKLTKEIDKGGYWSIPRMQKWIAEHYKKDIPEQTVWYRMDQLGYSYKGARPHPVQGNRDKQEAFKKKGLLRSWSR